MSEAKRNIQSTSNIIENLKVVFQAPQKLPCGTEATFNYDKNEIAFGGEHKIFFSSGRGSLLWPKDHIAVIALDTDNRIIDKKLLTKEETMVGLAMKRAHRFLLWGYLDQLPIFSHSSYSFGYYWGAMKQKSQFTALSHLDPVEVTLTCPP